MRQGIKESTKKNLQKTVFKTVLEDSTSRPYHFKFFKGCLLQI